MSEGHKKNYKEKQQWMPSPVSNKAKELLELVKLRQSKLTLIQSDLKHPDYIEEKEFTDKLLIEVIEQNIRLLDKLEQTNKLLLDIVAQAPVEELTAEITNLKLPSL